MVYVDDMRAPYGRLIMCHMGADTTAELLAMADQIGVNRKWLQSAGRPDEHFDIALSKRSLAVQHGAKEVTSREFVLRYFDPSKYRKIPLDPEEPNGTD